MKTNFGNTIVKAIIDNTVRIVGDRTESVDYKLGSVIELDSTDNGFNALNKIIYILDKKKFMENRYPAFDQRYYSLIENTSYWIRYKTGKDFIHVYSYFRQKQQYGNTQDVSTIRVCIYGPNRKRIRETMYNKILQNKAPDGKITVDYPLISQFEINTTTFEHVVLEKQIQRKLITSLYQWYKDKSWYTEHHLTHKIGILLYGEPGTGKSTLIRAISNMFGRANICIVDAFESENTVSFLKTQRAITNGIFIAVLEDIDLAFTSRENETRNLLISNRDPEKNQQLIFQLLDGTLSMEDTIFIATTNHKDRLDPALVRHGRFDIQIEMTKFDEMRALQFLNLFGYGKKDLEKMDVTYPIAPATLQSKVLEYRANGGKIK